MKRSEVTVSRSKQVVVKEAFDAVGIDQRVGSRMIGIIKCVKCINESLPVGNIYAAPISKCNTEAGTTLVARTLRNMEEEGLFTSEMTDGMLNKGTPTRNYTPTELGEDFLSRIKSPRNCHIADMLLRIEGILTERAAEQDLAETKTFLAQLPISHSSDS